MRRRIIISTFGACAVAAAGFAGAAVVARGAGAHTDPCHTRHDCPSDHHSYIWYDSSGVGWDCVRPDASERTAADTTLITYAGLPYYCHRTDSAPPATTTAATATAATTTAATTTSSATTTAATPTTSITATTATSPAVTSAAGPTPTKKSKPKPKPKPSVGHFVPPAATQTSHCTFRGPLPDPQCTPGAVFARATVAAICAPGYSSRVRDVSESTKARVYAMYGIAGAHHGRAYEVDHLISLELGGSNDISNLWPEAAAPVPGFHQKDGLENTLHARVCSGQMTLAAAQRQIAVNWLTALNALP